MHFDIELVIDYDIIEQIIILNLDESESMLEDMNS